MGNIAREGKIDKLDMALVAQWISIERGHEYLFVAPGISMSKHSSSWRLVDILCHARGNCPKLRPRLTEERAVATRSEQANKIPKGTSPL
ncbi:hypothetical protein LB518_20375 [Mesorhizobium sp. BR1-1-16]|uniref:hypothetical protein n=1 Tax=Mesorhizobium sp. BR1-1-16 TaxID=2876653 RepID=UPI001CCF453E|nr:hypothetical protein [Mesorhizobium sp. BR1-1-16]MBZ9938664.1 hypothetical protein [Mesorhizobium sp. BR1-1-16]